MAKTICNEKQCTGCAACVNICPKHCISMTEAEDGFKYPVINEDQCISCGACTKTCPNNKAFAKGESAFYMAIHKDTDVLKNSSSGGAFTALASYVLRQNGVVVGAHMDASDKVVRHIIIDNADALGMIRGSKYYQSNPEDSYKKAIEELKHGKYVLFSGTACQIAAMYSLTPEKYREKLITVDILCHGVSCKKVVDAYIKAEETRFKKPIVNYQFRIKEEFGWHSGGGTKMKLFFADGSSYIYEKSVDSFFMAFNNNVALRESCYQCKYCGTERIADFTIADFWGATEKRANEENQKNGISLLLCNSDKAKSLVQALKEDMEITGIDPQEAIPYNNALTAPNTRPDNRERFFNMVNSGVDFNRIINRLYWFMKTKALIKRMLGPNAVEIIKKFKRNGKS